MAELLGVASGVISVLQAVEKLGNLFKKIKVYREATDEVLAIANEVSDLQLILTEHRNVSQELNHTNSSLRLRLQKVLQNTGEKIDQVDRLIRLTLTQSGQTDQLKVNKIAWVRRKSEVDKLRQELRDMRRNIAEHFAILALRSQSRIGIQIDQISIDTAELGSRQDEILERVERAEFSVLGAVSSRNFEQRAALEEVVSSNRQIEGRLESTEEIVTSILRSQQNSHRMMHELMLEMSRADSRSELIDSQATNVAPIAIVLVTNKTSFNPEVRQEFLASCSLDIPDFRFWPRLATESNVYVESQRSNGGLVPRASLKIISYFSTETGNKLIRYSTSGDVQAIQQMLAEGLLSPNSMCPGVGGGWLPLERVLRDCCLDACELLLSLGADPREIDANGRSAINSARWLEFVGIREHPTETIRKLGQLFPTDSDEISSLPTLHRTILGFSSKPLEEHLSIYDGPLDKSIAWGFTALGWAMLRCDHKAVNALLEYERDEAIQKRLAESVMWMARSIPCVEVLLATGADIDAPGGEPPGSASIKTVNRTRNFPVLDLLKHFIKRNANPNQWCRTYETTLLSLSAFGDRVEIAAFLLKHGADVNLAVGTQQKRAVQFFLWLNAHKCLEFLLQHDLDCSLDTRRHTTVLHIVAEYSDVKTMEIVANAIIRGIDIDAKNLNGKKARELVRLRPDYTPELNEAFEALIFSIRSPIGELHPKMLTFAEKAEGLQWQNLHDDSSEASEPGSDNEGERFEDAQEHWDRE